VRSFRGFEIIYIDSYAAAGFVLQLLNLESRIKERNLGLLNGSDPRAVARFSDWSASYLIPSVSSSLSDCFDNSNSSRPQNVTDYAQLFSEADNDSSNGVNVLAEYPLDEAVIINCFINSRSYSAVEAEADAAKAAADAETREVAGEKSFRKVTFLDAQGDPVLPTSPMKPVMTPVVADGVAGVAAADSARKPLSGDGKDKPAKPPAPKVSVYNWAQKQYSWQRERLLQYPHEVAVADAVHLEQQRRQRHQWESQCFRQCGGPTEYGKW
jgi:hypothetical protein